MRWTQWFVVLLVSGCDGGLEGANFTALAVAPSDPNVVYASADSVTAHLGIFRSDDGGVNWSRTDTSFDESRPVRSLGVSPLDSEVLLVATEGGSLFRTRDGGGSWRRVAEGVPSGEVAYHPLRPEHAFFVGEDALLESGDGGSSWSEVARAPDCRPAQITDLGFDPEDAARMYALDSFGLWLTNDAGACWKRTVDGLQARELVVEPDRERRLWVVAEDGVYVSLDRGETFLPLVDWHQLLAWAEVPMEWIPGLIGPRSSALVDTGGRRLLLVGTENVHVIGVDVDTVELIDLGHDLIRRGDTITDLQVLPGARVLAATATTCKGNAAVFEADLASRTWNTTNLVSQPYDARGPIDDAISGRVIVRFFRNVGDDEQRALLEENGAASLTPYIGPLWWIVELDASVELDDAFEKFQELEQVDCVLEDVAVSPR
ncbi:MAG TPA: hypothetical protein VFB62_14705 [Polyangiaceae bacterium]|nr:hypothetical protein [Polyangiaceae bacterium]